MSDVHEFTHGVVTPMAVRGILLMFEATVTRKVGFDVATGG